MISHLSRYEKDALTPPPDLPVAEWIETVRLMPKGSAIPGKKKVSNSPCLLPLYEWFLNPRVREISIIKPAQIGATDALIDFICWISENDPSPTALFLADQSTAQKIMKFRIWPALMALGRVKDTTNLREKELTKFECVMPNGFYLVVSWGSSISQTASMAYKYIFTDEIDKPGYDAVGTEGDTLGRIRERMETYPDHKWIKLSTPTLEDGRITKEIRKATVTYDYCVPCPDCGAFQPLTFDRVSWEGGRKATPDMIYRTARYNCLHCPAQWTDNQRAAAVQQGQAIARGPEDNLEHIGYDLHRLYSLFPGGRMHKIINRWIAAQEEGPGELQNVINSIFGEPWVQFALSSEQMASDIGKCIGLHKPGTIPESVEGLIMTVDVQNQGFWYMIGGADSDSPSSVWIVEQGPLKTWEDVEKKMFQSPFSVWRALIDTGGGKEEDALISRTEETYNFIRANQNRGVQLFGSKGSSRTMPVKVKFGSVIEKTPSGKAIPGGLRILQLNTEALKEAFWWRVTDRTPHGLAGSIWLHESTPEYVLLQLTAERKQAVRGKAGLYEWKQIRRDNHLLDCMVMLLACIDPEFAGGVRKLIEHRKRQAVQAVQAKPVETRRKEESNPVTGRRL